MSSLTTTSSFYLQRKQKKSAKDKRVEDDVEDVVAETEAETEAEPKKKKKYPKKIWIERADFDALLVLLDQIYEKNSPRWFNLKLLYSILFWTGLRISEALMLSRNQIIEFIYGKSIQVVIPKTKTTRSLLNTPQIYEELKWFRQPEIESQIASCGLANSYGDKLTFRRAQKYSYPVLFALQAQKFGKVDDPSKLIITLHSFRCSYINRLLRNNVPLPDVSQLVAHRNVSTTLVYLREYPDIDKLNKMLANTQF